MSRLHPQAYLLDHCTIYCWGISLKRESELSHSVPNNRVRENNIMPLSGIPLYSVIPIILFFYKISISTSIIERNLNSLNDAEF
ncbi:hypothetical protein Glove_60g55 [Diversispora epigaea]|uniref:Uncharacterized protein n=1 Tax=Diversispora epigaea TaxID=1348612 RepID=A0A397JG73_9GLOM|nr:hypothetical protein Glove_60g55 [Diversispora epigaea]